MINALRRLRSMWYPDAYHGQGKTRKYFEGWYIKVVDPTEQHAWAFIPGISMDASGHQHAFIQSLDGKNNKTYYETLGADLFQPADKVFQLELGPHQFAKGGIQLALPHIEGQLQFENHFPWPASLGAPGVMGWYSFVPFMQCYHGVVSMNHRISGSLRIHGQEVDFTGGRGYMEKDWGVGFPKSWIWLQTNHFDQEGISLFASVAHIPWLGTYFPGFLVGFLFEGKLYKMATYTGAKMKVRLGENRIFMDFRTRNERLEIEAVQTAGGGLISPISGAMTGKVNESLQSIAHVRFFIKNQLVFEGSGRNAGMEVAGPIEAII